MRDKVSTFVLEWVAGIMSKLPRWPFYFNRKD